MIGRNATPIRTGCLPATPTPRRSGMCSIAKVSTSSCNAACSPAGPAVAWHRSAAANKRFLGEPTAIFAEVVSQAVTIMRCAPTPLRALLQLGVLGLGLLQDGDVGVCVFPLGAE